MDRAALEDCRAAATLVSLGRRPGNDARVHGFVIAVSDPLVLAHQFHDFYDEGWVIIRRADIVDIDQDLPQQFFAAVFRGEGLGPRAPATPVPLDDWATVLTALAAQGRPVIVECEGADPADDTFTMGRVVGVDAATVAIHELDALGRWDGVEPIALDRITKVQLDTPFLTTFARYAAPFPGPRAPIRA
jgi:hypothetical protein